MTHRTLTLAAALTMTVATLLPASASEAAIVFAEPFKAPATITVAYRYRNIATDAAQVLKQGGFATAGIVRWLPAASVTVEATAGTVKLGALEALD